MEAQLAAAKGNMPDSESASSTLGSRARTQDDNHQVKPSPTSTSYQQQSPSLQGAQDIAGPSKRQRLSRTPPNRALSGTPQRSVLRPSTAGSRVGRGATPSGSGRGGAIDRRSVRSFVTPAVLPASNDGQVATRRWVNEHSSQSGGIYGAGQGSVIPVKQGKWLSYCALLTTRYISTQPFRLNDANVFDEPEDDSVHNSNDSASNRILDPREPGFAVYKARAVERAAATRLSAYQPSDAMEDDVSEYEPTVWGSEDSTKGPSELGEPNIPLAPVKSQGEVASFLLEGLLGKQGCTEEQHRTKQHEHDKIINTRYPQRKRRQEGHFSISTTYGNKSPLVEPDDPFEPGLWNPRPPVPSAEAVSKANLTLATEMEGKDVLGTPRHICLHLDDNRETKVNQIWDIDSWIAIGSFATIKSQWHMIAFLQKPQVITDNLHIKVPARGNTNDEPRKVPHLYIGELTTADKYTAKIYVMLPKVEVEKAASRFWGLSDLQTEQFFDKVLRPSFEARDDEAQYLPPTYETARDKSNASRYETNNTAKPGSSRVLKFVIRPAMTIGMDERMRQTIADDARLAQFAEFYLLIDATGIKTHTKDDESLHHCMQTFEDKIRGDLDVEAASRFYVDIGMELISPLDNVAGSTDTADAYIYLQKTCCLEETERNFRQALFGNKSGVRRMFNHSYLRDVGSLNIQPPVKSGEGFKHGLRYAQWYNVYKAIFDAQSIYTFQHDNFTELSKGRLYHEMVAGGNQGGNKRKYDAIQQSYRHSKTRATTHLKATVNTPFGARMEYRVTWALYTEIKSQALAQETAPPDPPAFRLNREKSPSSMWAIRSPVWVNFLAGNLDKFARNFEMGMRNSPIQVSGERNKVLWIVLEALKHFQSCSLAEIPALCVDNRPAKQPKKRKGQHSRPEVEPDRRRIPAGDTEVGMGMGATMEEYGYGWFQSRISWLDWRFKQGFANKFLGWYAGSQRGVGGHLNVGRDAFDLITMYAGLLETYQESAICKYYLEALMCFAIFRAYRYDVVLHFNNCRKLKSVADKDGKDSVSFCWDGIHDAFEGPHVLVKPGRSNVETKDHLIYWIFGGEGKEPSQLLVRRKQITLKRKFYWDKGFRLAYQEARKNLMKLKVGRGTDDFDALFKHLFFKHHSMIPYPDSEGSLSSTTKADEFQDAARKWFHIDPAGGENMWYSEAPPSLRQPLPSPPGFTEWDADQLKEALQNIYI